MYVELLLELSYFYTLKYKMTDFNTHYFPFDFYEIILM
jgi:hypothetical protein